MFTFTKLNSVLVPWQIWIYGEFSSFSIIIQYNTEQLLKVKFVVVQEYTAQVLGNS